MALVSCPECGKNVSTKATLCPHCGCPSETTGTPATGFDAVERRSPVADIDLIIEYGAIDAHRQNVRVKAQAKVGLADGILCGGLPVCFYVNGHLCIEISTNDQGVAELDNGLPPRFFNTGENELVVRLRDSAKTAQGTFELLTNSSIGRCKSWSVDDRSGKAVYHDDHCEQPRREQFTTTVYLSPLDFVDPGGIKIGVMLEQDGKYIHHVFETTNSSGSAEVEIVNKYTAYEYYRRDFVGTSNYIGLDKVSHVVVGFWGAAFQGTDLKFEADC